MRAASPGSDGVAVLSAYRPQVLHTFLELESLLGETLEPATRELIRIAVQVVHGSGRGLRTSVSRALAEGATPDQIIDAVTLGAPEVGLAGVIEALGMVADFLEIPTQPSGPGPTGKGGRS
jgi:alkylhydroperoxidase/carboxymuconolactone decarboxylase family protein YurZ